MKKRLFRYATLTITILLLTVSYRLIKPIHKELSTQEIKEEICERLAKLPPDSEEAARLANLYERLVLKSKGKSSRAETPDKFLEALREIKTAFNGTVYRSNYRKEAMEKAEARNRLYKHNSTEALPWNERRIGNSSGRTQQLVIDPSDPSGSTWFAGTVGGGVWKTTNSGQSWTDKTPELTSLSTTTLDICRSHPDIIYVGTGMGFGRVVDLAGSGIWKSTDHGDNWFQLESTAHNELLAAINRLVVSPNDPNLVVVCSNDDYTSYGPNGGERRSGIFRTTDGGTTWTQVYDPDIALGTRTDNRVQQIVANPNDFNILYASVNEVGVVKSTDAGATWFTSANNFADPTYVGAFNGSYQGISTRIELAIAPSDPNRVYANVERTLGISQLYMTKDAGATWVNVRDTGSNPNWFSQSAASGATGVYTAGWFDNTIAVSPYNANVVYVGGVELYKLTINPTNNTRTSTEIAGTAIVHADHHDLDIIPVNQATDSYIIVNSNDGGVATSSNRGVTWNAINGLGSTQFYGADKAPGVDAYIGGQQDNGTWVSGTNPTINSNWFHVLPGDGFEAAWHSQNINFLIGGSQSSNLSRSTDGGATWTAVHSGGDDGAPFITKIASSDLDPDLLFTIVGRAVNRSDDFGATWISVEFAQHWLGFRAFDNVEISLADPQYVWITSPLVTYPWIGIPGGIHVSTDAGLTFNEVSQNFPNTVTESSGFATDPFDPNTGYALFSAAGTPKILRTTDLGNTWTDISGFSGVTGALNKKDVSENESTNGFPDVATYSLLVMPYNTNIIWAGTEIGLFISEDGGQTWFIADNGLPKVGIFQMFIQDGQVVVSTYGRGIWTVNLPELSGYTLPVVTLSPRLNELVQKTNGNVEFDIDLRSQYDSTKVLVNGILSELIPFNATPVTRPVIVPVTETTTFSIQVVSFKNGRDYKSPARTISVEPVNALVRYTNDFSSVSTANDFVGDNFSIRSYAGFSNNALHSDHPYGNANEFIYKLKYPIIVSSQNATLSYDDVAIIEEGTVNNYLDPNYFDYVIVEGSRDGITWIPFLNGYDARFDPSWSAAYNAVFNGNDSTTPGNETMFRNHTINLLNTFNAGERIFIRFRLHADALARAWGWVIDNLQIQPNASGSEEENELPTHFVLNQNYPNPFNPATTITYAIPHNSNVELKVYNINGEEVKTLVDENLHAGSYRATWDGKNNSGNRVSSGVYFYLIRAGDFTASKKMILLK